MLRIATATDSDAKDIAALLTAAQLPLPDPLSSASFLLAKENGASVGCIALQAFGSDALLRSHVVATPARGKGLGKRLVGELLDHVARQNIQTLYLLTIDAMEYFGRFGFVPVPRDEVPALLLASQEFLIHSCDNATCMRRSIQNTSKRAES